MSKTTEERVQHALGQLIERLIPTYAEEDEAAADERWQEAVDLANDTLGRQGDGDHCANLANHTAGLANHLWPQMSIMPPT